MYITHKINELLKVLIGTEIYYAPSGRTTKVNKQEVPVYFESDSKDPAARLARIKGMYIDINYNGDITLCLDCIDSETGVEITAEDDLHINI